MITLERVERRVYFVSNTYAHKDAIKSMGGKWDADRRQWWIGSAKEAEARKLLEEIGAGFDLSCETDRLVRADQLDEAGKSDEAAALRQGKPREDPANIRLTGKGTYKGRQYYLGFRTKDGSRIRCLTLPDKDGNFLDFWADTRLVEVTKTYESRQVWDGRRYSGRTVTQHTTPGSIARFIARQADPVTRRVQCPECDAWHDAGEPCRECGGC